MALNDEIRVQHVKLRDMSLKEKARYILDYYKFHILTVIVLAIAMVSLIHTIATRQDTAFYVAAVNSASYGEDQATIMEDFIAYSGIDPGKDAFLLDSSFLIDLDRQDPGSFGSLSKLLALFQSNEIDVVLADTPVINNYSEARAFADLREVLPSELLKRADEEAGLCYADYEDTGSTPIGVRLSGLPAISSYGLYPTDSDAVFAVAAGAKHQETAVRFLQFLLEAP